MRYVVIGASAAGLNGVRQLRALQPDAEIVLVSKDKDIYSRCILHHYMGGIRTKKELMFVEEDFEDRYRWSGEEALPVQDWISAGNRSVSPTAAASPTTKSFWLPAHVPSCLLWRA